MEYQHYLPVPIHLFFLPFLHYHPSRQGFERFCIFCRDVSKQNRKPTIPNTLTIVGGWNSNTISLYLYTYVSRLFLHYHPSRQEFERFCIFCRDVGEQNGKPTIPNTLPIVGGWNSNTTTQFGHNYIFKKCLPPSEASCWSARSSNQCCH